MDAGFFDIQKSLDEKRRSIKIQIENEFLKEHHRFLNKKALVDESFEAIKNIQTIYDRMIAFMDENVDARILDRADDLTTFMFKSITDLDDLKTSMINQKKTIFVDGKIRPMILDVKKALEYVNKFEFTYTGAPRKTVDEEKAEVVGGLGANFFSKISDTLINMDPNKMGAKRFRDTDFDKRLVPEEEKFDIKRTMALLAAQ